MNDILHNLNIGMIKKYLKTYIKLNRLDTKKYKVLSLSSIINTLSRRKGKIISKGFLTEEEFETLYKYSFEYEMDLIRKNVYQSMGIPPMICSGIDPFVGIDKIGEINSK